jgi:DMSO/TMAO reductase YedYZ molybdopterin-dependent catalytic subunit
MPPLDAPSVPMTVLPSTPAAAPFAVPSLTPEVLTAQDFYTVSKNLLDPKVDVEGWTLTIDGLVERPTTYSYADISTLPTHSDYYTLQCISNLVGGDLWGSAHWKGVRLVDLLTQTGLRPGVRKVIFHAADDYTDSIVIDVALRPDTLLAYEMNGEPLTKEHGFPARLLIPGIYGMKNVKWVTRIEVVDYDFKGYWMQRGWSDTAAYQTASRIDVPRNRATLPVGEIAIAGVAFAGDRGIDNVEVSFDDGKSWQQARVKPALSNNTWNLWVYRGNLESGTYPLKVRATDGTGQVQTEKVTDPLPDGATGYHSVMLRVG